MKLTNSVLVAVDFSPCSAAALKTAERVAAWKHAPLKVLHVVEMPQLPPPPYVPRVRITLPTEAEYVEDARRQWREFARKYDVSADAMIEIELGNPRDVILDIVKRTKPGLLVLGAHSKADARAAIGLTAATCAQWAATEVMVVREDQRGPFKAVLACVDFSDTSCLALEQAIAVAAEGGSILHILHVYRDPWIEREAPDDIKRNMPDFAERYRDAVEDRLREFCKPLAHELNAVKPVFHGLQAPTHAEGIISFADRHGCDLVVLGTRGRWNMRDFFWGSTAERVVREAPCSVLAIKPASFTERAAYQPFADAEAALQQAE